ncbi:hypothetical protein [Streptacidiphilus albus]|uniref:hypothetical protein n=1 Tax=Streptacidiphilus albus TaxID=105425 RepID=UPI0006897278|nr:hypothetical protein [Streptacidiphilus albus]
MAACSCSWDFFGGQVDFGCPCSETAYPEPAYPEPVCLAPPCTAPPRRAACCRVWAVSFALALAPAGVAHSRQTVASAPVRAATRWTGRE